MKSKIIIFIIIFLGILSLYIYKPFLFRENIVEIVKASEVETHEYFNNKVQQYSVVSCEFGLKDVQHTFVYEEVFKERKYYGIEHYNIKRETIFSQTLNAEYIGRTDIKNTNFSELIDMAEDNCTQFQKSKGDSDDNTINWSYSEYIPEPPEPELSEEQKILKEEWEEEMRKKTIENRKNAKPIEDLFK